MPTIPNALAMRTLKFGGAPEAEREQAAEALRAADRHVEALLLYEGRASHPALRQARERALSRGLAFTLLALRRLGFEVTDADFRACARAAEGAQRWLDARQCYLALGAAPEGLEGLQRIAQHLPASLKPPPPPPAAASAPALTSTS